MERAKRSEKILALVTKLEAARGEELKVLAVYHLPELLEIARWAAGVRKQPCGLSTAVCEATYGECECAKTER